MKKERINDAFHDAIRDFPREPTTPLIAPSARFRNSSIPPEPWGCYRNNIYQNRHIDISVENVAAETEYFKIWRPSADLSEDVEWEKWLQIEKEIREIFKHLGWIRTYESAQYG